jgi:hypothetical protein
MGEDFAAFERLETVGELHVLSKKVKNVSFPNLTAVRLNMNFDQTSAVHTLDFPELTTIDRSLRIYYADSLTAMNFPKLEQVRENATIEGRNTGIPLQLVDFPELTAVGGTLALTYVGKEEGCTFTAAKLATAGGLDVATSDVLSGIRFPALTAVNGDLSISKLAALADVQFPALTTVSGNLSMSTLAALTDLQLPALHTVAGTLKLTLPTLTKLTGLKALRKVGSFDATDLQAIDTLDVRGIEEIGTLILGYNTLIRTKGLTLVGNETFPGKLSLLFTTATTAPASAPDFPLTVKGIKTVEGLEIAGTPNTGMAPFDMMDISWLERVTGLLKISGMQRIKGINLSNLQSAGDLKLLNLNFLENLNLPKLEEITGYASGAATVGGFEFSGTSKVAAIELPELKSVEGNISITGLPAGNPTSGTISFPELESLTGTLTITSTNNAKFTSLNGFSALESAAGITISGFTQLSDFSPLGKVVCSLPDFIAWKITNCGGTATDYTFEKMQELYCGQNP